MNYRLYIPVGGGLGDVVRCYLKDEQFWGYLSWFKQHYTNSYIKILSTSHNLAVEEFFKYNPYISEFKEFGWDIQGRPIVSTYKQDFILFQDVLSKYKDKKWAQPIYYLREQDNVEVNKIIQPNIQTIIIHPFAIRRALGIEEFIYITDKLIDNFGYQVVFIGATNNRIYNKDIEPTYSKGIDMIEECTYERPGLINLLNKSNIRIAYKLIELCNGFIGQCSCFNMAAWIHKKRTVTFSRHFERDLMTHSKTYAWPIIDRWPSCKNFFDDEDTPRQHSNETIEFFAR